MAQSKEFFTRIQHKHDIETNWSKAVNFIPLVGEIIVYDKDEEHDYARIKIGDGSTKINELPFVSSKIATDDEILELLTEVDMLPVVTDEDGLILADENDEILLW